MDNVLLLAKTDSWCNHAVELSHIAFGDRLIACQGTSNDPFPDIPQQRGSVLLSFRSPWIVPASILNQFDVAINFHPGSRDYPGYGCYSFAIYERAAEYGCVCHHMAAAVDTGPIVAERRFPMIEGATVETLKLRTYTVMLALFHDMIFQLARDQVLPRLQIGWSRRPFTRREYEALATVSPNMSDQEIQRRVRATTYPGEGARLMLGGMEFHAATPSRSPLA